jgi:hypothetical protein
VRTERECRTLERTTGIRYSADVHDPGRIEPVKRRPDLVIEQPDGRTKGAARVRQIIEGYLHAT